MHAKVRKLIWIAPLAVLGLLLFVAVGGMVVQLLWNTLLPSLFGWREVTFWQALGLLALCRILFGGFSSHGSAGARVRRRMAERWERLTPEERERFRQGKRDHCGAGPAAENAELR